MVNYGSLIFPFSCQEQLFKNAYGDTCPLYLLERRKLMANWQLLSNVPKQVAQWVPQMGATRSRSFCHATG